MRKMENGMLRGRLLQSRKLRHRDKPKFFISQTPFSKSVVLFRSSCFKRIHDPVTSVTEQGVTRDTFGESLNSPKM